MNVVRASSLIVTLVTFLALTTWGEKVDALESGPRFERRANGNLTLRM